MKNKARRQVFSLILSLCMALALLPAAAPVQATDDPPVAGSITSFYGDSDFCETYADVIQAVTLGIEQKNESIDLSGFQICANSEEEISAIGSAIYLTALYQHPEFFWADDTVWTSYSSGTTYQLYSLIPKYFSYDDGDLPALKAAFEAEAERYLDMVRDNPTVYNDDFSRALLLHDELALDAAYSIEPNDENSNYRFLVGKLGICENYSRIYAYLLSQLGISCEMVSSYSMSHEWIKLCLDGTYYHVDLTWDDPVEDMPGRVPHTCFLLSDEKIQNEVMGSKRHYGFDTLYPSEETRYDDAAFHTYNSKLCKLTDGPILYAIGENGLVSYNYDTNTESTVLAIETKWPVVEKPGSNWPGVYSGLDSYDGWLYYNTPQEICKYNVSTGGLISVCSYDEFESLPENNYFYGLHIRGNTLYASVAPNPNTAGTEYPLMELQPQLPAQVYGHSLSLDGRIGVNTYLLLGEKISSAPDSYQVEFYEGETLVSATVISNVESEKEYLDEVEYTVYPFSFTAASNQMDTVFTMKLRDVYSDSLIPFANTDGSLVDAETGLDYSVQAYLDEAAVSGSEALKPLASAMHDYGVFAKHYFRELNEGSTEGLPDIDGFVPVTAEDLSMYADQIQIPADIDEFSYQGTSLLLEDDTALRMYFQSDNVNSLTIVYDGDELEILPGQGMHYVQISDIGAPQLNETFRFIISNGSDEITAELGPMGYALHALSGEGVRESLQYLMMALYHYSQTAYDYFSD